MAREYRKRKRKTKRAETCATKNRKDAVKRRFYIAHENTLASNQIENNDSKLEHSLYWRTVAPYNIVFMIIDQEIKMWTQPGSYYSKVVGS